jgi:peptide/nickel transport system permease protein
MVSLRKVRAVAAHPVTRRLALSIIAMFVASFLVYAATTALPGDYATAALGREATPQAIEALRKSAGLDQPLILRYGRWLNQAVHGDLGTSFSSKRQVWVIIEPNLGHSVLLAIAALLLTIPLAVSLGLVSGLRKGGWFDGVVGAITLALVSMPEFVLGLFLAFVFGIALHVLSPVSLLPEGATPADVLSELILPATAVAGVTIGYILRMTRVATIDVLDTEYIRAARLRGVGSWRLLFWHVARNAMIPVVNVIGNQVAWMLGGIIATELVFAYPGIGMLLVSAIIGRDAPLVAGICLLITVTFIITNLLADLFALLLNPRLRSMRA